MKKYLGNKTMIALFIAPTMLFMIVMVFYPLCILVKNSFADWDGLNTAVFTGLKNYRRIFKDPLFYTSLKNGIIYAVIQTCYQIPIATFLAFAVKSVTNGEKKFFRIAYYIPAVLSVTVVCQLWVAIYDADYGLINKLFEAIGLSYRQNWLSGQHTGIRAITFVGTWQYTGYQFILLLSAANSVPGDYFEAALLDGCSKFKAHLRITIPLMQEAYKYCLIIAFTGGLNAFATMNIMTGGGPGTSTYTLTYMMYRSAFLLGKYGYGCTSAVLLVAQALLFSFIVNKVVAREQIIY